MSGSGRMAIRLARSYREDDLRRSADARRRQAITADPSESTPAAGVHPRGLDRIKLAAIRRLLPHLA